MNWIGGARGHSVSPTIYITNATIITIYITNEKTIYITNATIIDQQRIANIIGHNTRQYQKSAKFRLSPTAQERSLGHN